MATGYDDLIPKSPAKDDYADLIPEPIKSPEEQPSQKGYDLIGGAKEVGKAGGLGALAGAFAPEILSGAGAAMRPTSSTSTSSTAVIG